jgi:ornithine lipid hydroxylase
MVNAQQGNQRLAVLVDSASAAPAAAPSWTLSGAPRRVLSHVLWPALVAAFLGGVYAGIEAGHSLAGFNLAYLALALIVAGLERVMPHERAWLADDGQMGVDLAHTLVSKGAAQIVVTAQAMMGLAGTLSAGPGLWPHHWPLVAQVALGLVVAEFGLYWKHRISHESLALWRFHAVHHSATRLWFWNTGRFHVVDTVAGIVAATGMLWLAGAPELVYRWVGASTAVIGMLTHCNIDLRCGAASLVFNTPNLHRWHHSMDPREGNRNYGENLAVFDLLFGTYFNPRRVAAPRLGIATPMPKSFLGQLAAPFDRDFLTGLRDRAR